jgi:hypothetical protein
MTEPKPEPAEGDSPSAAPADESAKVREQIGEGLRKFYDSVLGEPIPAEWVSLVGGPPPAEDE